MAHQASGPNTGFHSGIDLDPIDWERRVAEARARRELALARRARAAGAGERPGDPGAPRAGKEPPGAPWSYLPAPRAAIRATAHAARLPSAAGAMSAASGAFSAASGVLELAMPRRRTRLAAVLGSGLALGVIATAALLFGGSDPAPLPLPAETAAIPPAAEAPDPAPGPETAAITTPAPSRPEAVVEPVRLSLPEAEPDAAPAPVVAAEPAQTPAAATPGTMTAMEDARIFLHVPAGAPSATTEAVLAALSDQGLPVAGLVPVRLEVGRSNLRYYHAEDAAIAEEIAAALGVTPVGAIEARDFAETANRPAPGTVEIWLAGDAKPGPAPTLPLAPETAEAPVARPLPRDNAGIDPQVIRNLVEAARASPG
ncbi:MAG TPA: hypothetical protein PLH75_06020 [Amaricoccus sp.]|uniref:hypothetical protein n=1 Tax=Amaricoccus sp. TaxID=1872485 RepID=UPI002CBB6469|nr:hypothetical protein [Amaricoccus sp.]HPG22327.1 hypothetical protein [Amaricoccus sp.]HRW16471.1 hypothetical protein [Amaricoccus sp.]